MSTAFRGVGCYKIDLYNAIRKKFGYLNFAYKDARVLPEFDRSTFFRLASDKIILRSSKNSSLYRLAIRYTRNRSPLKNTPDWALKGS